MVLSLASLLWFARRPALGTLLFGLALFAKPTAAFVLPVAAVFAWCGRNWTGPSDFANPVGDPFPPGTYTFEVRGRGTRVDENRVEHQFEIVAEYELQLVE